jgi:t-SNARE complex subunit (syntaxin)
VVSEGLLRSHRPEYKNYLEEIRDRKKQVLNPD